jgi:hypothetical protein
MIACFRRATRPAPGDYHHYHVAIDWRFSNSHLVESAPLEAQ